ncbi:hypothetical protein GCM10010472_54120 [Pseudonocardia halophobica]|uniref:Uncharacterized protein n=1 Tax=Pseudonocardia halophobica TaxID=29401 RepID=A0A9W6L0N4_9PSEU|nr:hypothetical protein [Pseudonocardia halophobica]GLL11491.1 hypothetical protein GCM10017577_26320 [Pseudonocardia halophobica]
MEQAFSADVLVPLGVGAAALVIAVVIVVVRALRGKAKSQPVAEPTHSDWTGESVGEMPAPRPAPEPVPAGVAAGGAAAGGAAAGPDDAAALVGQARPRTVADAVAVREADTAPLPVQSDVLLARARAHRAAAEHAAAIQTEARRAASGDDPGPQEESRGDEPGPGRTDGRATAVGHRSLADQGAVDVEADAAGEDTSAARPAGDATSEGAAEGVTGRTAPAEPPTTGADEPAARAAAADRQEGVADVVSLRRDSVPVIGESGPRSVPADRPTPDAEEPELTPATRAARLMAAAKGAPTPYARSREAVPESGQEPAAGDAVAPTDERPTAAQLAALAEQSTVPAASTDATGPAPSGPDGSADGGENEPETETETETVTGSGAADQTSADRPAQAEPPGSEPQDADQQEPAQPGGLEPVSAEQPGIDQPGPEEAGSSRTVAAAVQHALAARARAAQPNGVVDPRRGDARDRLLAVLLDDPARAVGATVELQSQQEELSRLAEEMRTRRDELGAVVRRLAAAGLGPDQVAKLAGLDRAEVDRMLGRPRRP